MRATLNKANETVVIEGEFSHSRLKYTIVLLLECGLYVYMQPFVAAVPIYRCCRF